MNAANRDMVKAYLKRMTQSEDEPIFMTARNGRRAVRYYSHPITFKEFVEVAGKMGKVSLQDKERFCGSDSEPGQV